MGVYIRYMLTTNIKVISVVDNILYYGRGGYFKLGYPYPATCNVATALAGLITNA
jgi:hypothetical protein